MRRVKTFICIALIILTLQACSFVGETDYAMFEERFNKANKEIQLVNSNIISENLEKSTKYNCFFDAENGGKYMMTIYEKNGSNIITSCTLCILSSINLDINSIKELFCSMLFAYSQTDREISENIFNELKLNEENTYKKNGNTTKEFDSFKINIIVNGAGTAITIC